MTTPIDQAVLISVYKKIIADCEEEMQRCMEKRAKIDDECENWYGDRSDISDQWHRCNETKHYMDSKLYEFNSPWKKN